MQHSISESVTIDATRDEVFNLISNPAECVRASPSQEFSDIEMNEDGSHEFDYTYNMAGVRLTGHCLSPEYDSEEHILVYNYQGDIDAEMSLNVTENENGNTEFSCETTYEVSDSLFGKVVNVVLERYNSRELETFTKNVKEMIENGWAQTQV